MGPSRPTEPPVPMDRAEARLFTTTRRGRITPERTATASITSGTPCPFAERAKNHVRGPTRSPPAAGMRRIHHQGWARTRAMV